MIRVTELKGYPSVRALNAFHTLMLGLKMLPEYAVVSYEDFFARVESMDQADQERMIRAAVLFVELQKEEVENLCAFCLDANGVPYSSANLKSADPKLIVEMMIAVCKEIAKIKIDLVTEAEKKN